MNNSKLSSFSLLKILGCFIFDIAIFLAFFNNLGLFFIIATGKSILILIILLVGLLLFNGAVVFPSLIFKRIGIPYTITTVILLLLYVILANFFSILMISSNFVWYMVWELIIFAVFLVIFSIIMSFSKTVKEDIVKLENEKTEITHVMVMILEIEGMLKEKENQVDILSCITLFKDLKERIQASTPFGRIKGNSSVAEIENQIKNNLLSMKTCLQADDELAELKKLFVDTQRLIVNRETLNIK